MICSLLYVNLLFEGMVPFLSQVNDPEPSRLTEILPSLSLSFSHLHAFLAPNEGWRLLSIGGRALTI